MATVYFVRHGTTDYNLKGIWQGEINTPLATQGIKEVSFPVPIDVIFSINITRRQKCKQRISARGVSYLMR